MAILDDFDNYMEKTKKKAIRIFSEIDKKSKIDSKRWNIADGFMEVNTIRGKILEKMGISDTRFTTVIPRYNENTTVRVFEICSHTYNPEVPVGTLSLRLLKRKKKCRLMGHTDLSPFLESNEERALFIKSIKNLCRKYNKNYEELNEKLRGLFYSIYRNKQRGGGIGIAFDLSQKEFPFLKDVGETFIRTYKKIVERTKDKKLNKKAREAMLLARGQWVEFNLVEDKGFVAGIKIGIPPEAMILQTLPPLV
ncbi:MAG: coproporphyrinogen III oxidase, partial [Candidatus Schekmanbacteria bacterium]